MLIGEERVGALGKIRRARSTKHHALILRSLRTPLCSICAVELLAPKRMQIKQAMVVIVDANVCFGEILATILTECSWPV